MNRHTCKSCGGEGKVIGMFPVYAEHVPQEDRKPYIEVDCPTCDGEGTLTDAQLHQIALGKGLREKRRTKRLGLRECAVTAGVDPVELAYAEQGKRPPEVVAALGAIIDGLESA